MARELVPRCTGRSSCPSLALGAVGVSASLRFWGAGDVPRAHRPPGLTVRGATCQLSVARFSCGFCVLSEATSVASCGRRAGPSLRCQLCAGPRRRSPQAARGASRAHARASGPGRCGLVAATADPSHRRLRAAPRELCSAAPWISFFVYKYSIHTEFGDKMGSR